MLPNEHAALAASDPTPDEPTTTLQDPAAFITPAVVRLVNEAPEMPNPLDLIDGEDSVAANLNRLLEADALLNATALTALSQRLIAKAQQSDDLDELRKAVQTVREGAMLHEKRKTTAASQAPLTIVFERGSVEGVAIDVRSGKRQAPPAEVVDMPAA